MRVACLQICTGEDVATNLSLVACLLERAAAERVQLVVLPEIFALLSGDPDRKKLFAATEARQRVLPFLAEQAVRHGMTIIGGSLLLPGDGGKLRNSCPVYGPAGSNLGNYDKIHLFDVDLPDRRYHESEQIQAGNAPQIVDCGDWRIGLSICYDIRFPELYRHYASHGCNLLPVPAAFTVPTGQAHWEVLLRARAIENQAYVLAAAQFGEHPDGRRTYGHSMIIDPWGVVVARATNRVLPTEGELVIADLDLQHLDSVRRQIPALEHRKL